MKIDWSIFWPIIATVASICSTVICGLAMFIFNGFREELKNHRNDITAIKERMAVCRRECDDNHASKEDYLREAGYTRRFQENQIAAMAKIEARLDIVQQLPEIAGQVAKAVVIEMKRGA